MGRCSRCDHPFVAVERPDANWFLSCPRRDAESRRLLLALFVAFAMGGVVVLTLASRS